MVIRRTYHEEITSYQADLAKGKHTDTLDENLHWISNRINRKLYDQGCGISQIEEEVHNIRLAIQRYFDSYNPIRVHKGK